MLLKEKLRRFDTPKSSLMPFSDNVYGFMYIITP